MHDNGNPKKIAVYWRALGIMLLQCLIFGALLPTPCSKASPDFDAPPLSGNLSTCPSTTHFRGKISSLQCKAAIRSALAIGTAIGIAILLNKFLPAVIAGTVGIGMAFGIGGGTFTGFSVTVRTALRAIALRKPIKNLRAVKRIIQGAQVYIDDHLENAEIKYLDTRDSKKHIEGSKKRLMVQKAFDDFYSKVLAELGQYRTSELDSESYRKLYAQWLPSLEKIQKKSAEERSANENLVVTKINNFALMVKITEEIAGGKEFAKAFPPEHPVARQSRLMREYLRSSSKGMLAIVRDVGQFNDLFELISSIEEGLKISKEDFANILVRPLVFFQVGYHSNPARQHDDIACVDDLTNWILQHIRFVNDLKREAQGATAIELSAEGEAGDEELSEPDEALEAIPILSEALGSEEEGGVKNAS